MNDSQASWRAGTSVESRFRIKVSDSSAFQEKLIFIVEKVVDQFVQKLCQRLSRKCFDESSIFLESSIRSPTRTNATHKIEG